MTDALAALARIHARTAEELAGDLVDHMIRATPKGQRLAAWLGIDRLDES